MKYCSTLTLFISLLILCASMSAQNLQYYELRTYHCSTDEQLDRLDKY